MDSHSVIFTEWSRLREHYMQGGEEKKRKREGRGKKVGFVNDPAHIHCLSYLYF